MDYIHDNILCDKDQGKNYINMIKIYQIVLLVLFAWSAHIDGPSYCFIYVDTSWSTKKYIKKYVAWSISFLLCI